MLQCCTSRKTLSTPPYLYIDASFPFKRTFAFERNTKLVLSLMSPGINMPDAMKSLQNGLLATVVRGNQHSLQRAKERHIESDSVAESWPWLDYRLLCVLGINSGTEYASLSRPLFITTQIIVYSPHKEIWLCMFRVLIMFAGTHRNRTFYICHTCCTLTHMPKARPDTHCCMYRSRRNTHAHSHTALCCSTAHKARRYFRNPNKNAKQYEIFNIQPALQWIINQLTQCLGKCDLSLRLQWSWLIWKNMKRRCSNQ